jgi:hypothetical protein
MLSVLSLAMFIACGVHGSFFIQENGVLVPSSSEYHAYDDSCSVNFNNVDAVDFDILVFEVCREQPCPSQFDEVSELLDCAGLIDHFNDSTWYNQYVSEQISLHGICQSIHDRNDELQIGANTVLQHGDGRPWLNVRQPLALEFLIDEHMLELWTRLVKASDGAMETSRLVREVNLSNNAARGLRGRCQLDAFHLLGRRRLGYVLGDGLRTTPSRRRSPPAARTRTCAHHCSRPADALVYHHLAARKSRSGNGRTCSS